MRTMKVSVSSESVGGWVHDLVFEMSERASGAREVDCTVSSD